MPENNQTKEKLLAEISRLNKELKKKKKYGLVWDSEREPEEVVEMCKGKLPVLKEVKSKEIITDKNKPVNLLIEGDNYHALSVLNYTHAKKIDLIYIDPPYNTGNKSWKYNNSYVEQDDSYLHSKWLNMMEKRLILAKKLLKKDGCLICAIDENEFANLCLLLNKIFTDYKLDQVVIVHNPRGVQGKNFSYTHEYALYVYPNDGKEYIGNIERGVHLTEELRDHGGESLRTDARNCFYPIITDGKKIIEIGDVPVSGFHPKSKNTKLKNGLVAIWPIDVKGIERKWVFAKDTVFEILNNLEITKRSDGFLDVLRKKTEQKPRTVWIDQKYDASTYGSKVVRQITGVDFPYPKSLPTVKDCLSIIVKNRKFATVLDFFAGSGTTGHAVLELNKEDDGNRKFIICTNNENKICEEVTYPRVQKTIKGYRKNGDGEKVSGLGGNLKYFKTDFVNFKESSDKNKIRMTEEAIEMLCVKEGTFEEVENRVGFKIFKNQDHHTGIIFDQLAIKEFKKAISDIKGKFSVYIFSLGDDTFDDEFEDIKNKVKLSPIPEAILKVYRKIFQ
jgi:adenine-specific DNA-methyltransferase